ncbi:MAG TPA: class I SAM-dependent methyltransferase [Micromonosporaceae bacterium]
MTSMKFHLNRASALSFGSAGEQYDRFRPSPPPALIDDLVALRPVDVLDVGCGTGKVAVDLVGRGMRVLGVEIDERMADLARGHGVPVEVAEFESWDATGRRFDLITCADAWHWIDPVRGSEKAAAVLRPGGTLALFWSYYLLADDVAARFQLIYDEHAPQARTHSYQPLQAQGDPFEPISALGPIERRHYRWEATVSAANWAGLVATFSDHRALTPQRLTTVQTALGEAIEELGGSVTVTRGVHAAFARRR